MESEKPEDNTVIIERRLDNYIKTISKREGFITYQDEKKNCSKTGGSYIGIVYEITINGKTANGDKEINIFSKNRIHIDPMIYSIEGVYQREVFFYLDLSKVFDSLQIGANVPEREIFKVPYAFEETNNQSILLENMTKKRFKTYHSMEVTSLKYASLAMENLAKFHALSFVVKEKMPDYFEHKIKTIKAPYYFDDFSINFGNNMVDKSLKYLNKSILDKYEKCIREKVNNYGKYFKDESSVRVLCHGDYRPNNLMVREKDGNPEEVLTIDFQIINYGNPVLDIIYFVIWATDQSFRNQHLTTLTSTYYEYMDKYLKHFDLELKNIMPRKEFENQLKEKFDFGVYVALVYLPFIFHSEENAPDLTDVEGTIEKDIEVDPRFVDRLNGLFEDFIKWGLIK